MQKGADAISIEHIGKTETGFTTVENKIKDKTGQPARPHRFPLAMLRAVTRCQKRFGRRQRETGRGFERPSERKRSNRLHPAVAAPFARSS